MKIVSDYTFYVYMHCEKSSTIIMQISCVLSSVCSNIVNIYAILMNKYLRYLIFDFIYLGKNYTCKCVYNTIKYI